MATKPLDPDTQQRVAMIIDRARRSGANVPTRLNDARLLWTKDQEQKTRVSAVQDLIMEFDVWKPHEFLRIINRELTNCTPADMHQAVRTFLEQYLDHVKAGGTT